MQSIMEYEYLRAYQYSYEGCIEDNHCIIEITDGSRGIKEQMELIQKKISGEIETTGSSGNGIGLENVQDRIHQL